MQNLLLHSKYSHRLHHEIIRNAVAAQEIDLSIGNNKVLNQKELLTLLTTYTTNGFSIWDCLIDSLNDSLIPVRFAKSQEVPVSIHDKFSVHENSYSVENFSYSSRSPFTINSLITCFGADLGLSHLQHYLLNSHWKEAAQMVEKAREIIEEDKGSYVDGTFLKRTLVDAATIFDTCITNEIECPYFILSCVTTMKNYQQIYDKVTSLFNNNLKNVLNEKFLYLPLSESGRVSQTKYFKTEKNHLTLSEKLIDEQNKKINEIIKKYNGI